MFLAAGELPRGSIWRSETWWSNKGAEGNPDGQGPGNEASIEASAHTLERCFPVFSECVSVCGGGKLL